MTTATKIPDAFGLDMPPVDGFRRKDTAAMLVYFRQNHGIKGNGLAVDHVLKAMDKAEAIQRGQRLSQEERVGQVYAFSVRGINRDRGNYTYGRIARYPEGWRLMFGGRQTYRSGPLFSLNHVGMIEEAAHVN